MPVTGHAMGMVVPEPAESTTGGTLLRHDHRPRNRAPAPPAVSTGGPGRVRRIPQRSGGGALPVLGDAIYRAEGGAAPGCHAAVYARRAGRLVSGRDRAPADR